MATVAHSLGFFQRTKQESCPQSPHSTDPGWKPNNHEEKLLEFLEPLILNVARTHPAITQQDIAEWLAFVVEGNSTARQREELRAWRKKTALAKQFLEKFPDCAPARQFLDRFKEKFDYEFKP
jgi:hypothetical protein